MKTNGQLKISSLIKKEISPIIVYDWNLMRQLDHFVQNVSSECHWYHTVEREIDESKPGKISVYYYMREIFIPKQKVSGAQVETDALSFPMLCEEIKAKYNKDVALYNPIIKKMTAWCHSHVNMHTSPSPQDMTTYNKMCEDGLKQTPDQPQVMLIFNKRGEAFSRIFDPELQYEFENVQIYTEAPPDVDLAYINRAIETKLETTKSVAYELPNQKKTNTEIPAKTDQTKTFTPQAITLREKVNSRFTKLGLTSNFISMAIDKFLLSETGVKTFIELYKAQQLLDTKADNAEREAIVEKMTGLVDEELMLSGMRIYLNVISGKSKTTITDTIHQIETQGEKFKGHSLLFEKMEENLLALQSEKDSFEIMILGLFIGYWWDNHPTPNINILRSILYEIELYKVKNHG